MAVILIVDDQVDACRPLALLMRHLGHRGVCVYSGEDALAYLRAQKPDLMILDVMMPGMDGLEVLRHVRNDPNTRHLPVVMFSAISDPTYQEHARDKGANDYWVKASIQVDEMRRRIEALIPESGSGGTSNPPLAN
jgi:CheY-like chemotaxis protein